MRRLGLLALLVLAVAPFGARAITGPHQGLLGNCQACHYLHFLPGSPDPNDGGTMTKRTNSDLCFNCHSTAFPDGWYPPEHNAVAGISGASHNWDALADNLGATPPSPSVPAEAPMASRLVGGRLQCTVCHDEKSTTYGTTPARYAYAPLLRADNTDSAICVICHKDRNQSRAKVINQDAGYPVNGTNVFHHPVGTGVTLNVNGGGYDRAATAILDANGQTQPSGTDPAGTSNDLLLGTGSQVTCDTCHSVHRADSNSLTGYQ